MPSIATLADAIFEQLANEERRVLSGWRALVFARRATFNRSPQQRRWSRLPSQANDLYPLFRQMQQRGEIQPIKGFRHIYEVTLPYARHTLLDEREVLAEAHPYAILSHITALTFHGLTDEQSMEMVATIATDTSGGLLPIGTQSRDWEGIARPGVQRPTNIFTRPVRWRRVKPALIFGFEEYQPLGFPLRITTLEKTLIDALQAPDLSGGVTNVLNAWVRAHELIDVDQMVNQVERHESILLQQRVGYLLEQLGMTHPAFEIWQPQAHRGSSSRLIASSPFASTFDERWSLSINAPVHLLRESSG